MWRFGFINNSFIFNYADLFISLGIIIIIEFIRILIIFAKEEDKKELIRKEEQNEKNNKQIN